MALRIQFNLDLTLEDTEFLGGRCSCLILRLCFNQYGLGMTSFRTEIKAKSDRRGSLCGLENGGFSHQKSLLPSWAVKIVSTGCLTMLQPIAHGGSCLSQAAAAPGFLKRGPLGD